jgi:glycosyltransferase involved in cell wall biosynthesis
VALVFFYPQLKKLTGAERLILKLADYTARRLEGKEEVILLTHRFAPECRPALGPGVQLIETGWPMQPTGNHYMDAAVEYALGPALALRLPKKGLRGVIFFGPPSVPALWLARRVLFPLMGKRVPVLYFCFEPPRFIYSDTEDIVARLGTIGQVLKPLFHIYRALDRKMVGAAHRVLSNSPYGSRRIWNAYKRRATVIEHGVDFPSPSSTQSDALKERYQLGDRPVVVTVNHLHPRKRIGLFLEAVAVAREYVPGLVGLVVGDGPERASLEEKAVQLGLEVGRDVIFTGAVPEEELPAHYAVANVYMHTGREESFGLSVIEALKLGVPVVSVAEGGPLDTVRDEVSGRLVPPTARDLGEALASLLADPVRAQEMGRAGASFVATHYNWERGVSTLLRVLRDVSSRLGHVQ